MPNPTRSTTEASYFNPGAMARRALAALDLTRLEMPVAKSGQQWSSSQRALEVEAIVALCTRAATPFGTPAAVCVFAEFVATAREALAAAGIDQHVRIATVANFPDGDASVDRVRREIDAALDCGADEIDVVFPYRSLLAGDADAGRALVAAARTACDKKTLKVILETGELARPTLTNQAACIALDGGADFLKTSTGKVAVNATPESAELLLTLIRDTGSTAGLKVSGGVRDVASAAGYLDQADRILRAGWADPDHFRIGASSLLDDILRILKNE